jgi:hypothetical protein
MMSSAQYGLAEEPLRGSRVEVPRWLSRIASRRSSSTSN